MTTLEEAIKARDEFLKEKPHLQEFQNGLDNVMKNKTPEQRLIVISNLMHMMKRQLDYNLSSLTMQLEVLEEDVKALNETVQDIVQEQQK